VSGERILIVDDNTANLALTSTLLRHEGYETRTAEDAQEALAVLEAFHPDLILMDIQLPGMDGLELTEKLKSDPKTNHITIVALTAYATQLDYDKALRAGCDGYETKPIDTRTFPGTIRHYLDIHGSHAA